MRSSKSGKHEVTVHVGRSDRRRTVARVKKPATRANVSRSQRKADRKPSKRASYLPTKFTEPLRALANAMADRRDRALLLVLIDSELTPLELVSLSRGQIRVHFARQRDMSVKALGTGCLSRTSSEPGRKFTIGHEAVEALRNYINFDRVRGDHPALFTDRGGRMAIHTLLALTEQWLQEAKDQPN